MEGRRMWFHGYRPDHASLHSERNHTVHTYEINTFVWYLLFDKHYEIDLAENLHNSWMMQLHLPKKSVLFIHIWGGGGNRFMWKGLWLEEFVRYTEAVHCNIVLKRYMFAHVKWKLAIVVLLFTRNVIYIQIVANSENLQFFNMFWKSSDSWSLVRIRSAVAYMIRNLIILKGSWAKNGQLQKWFG